ncbi:VanW family protein [Candidatus Peregrinibacteria bacterium]|nr:MAG: VanW family protein [Candidatus Peregrinibacteria bacterium]
MAAFFWIAPSASAREYPTEITLKTNFNVWPIHVERAGWVSDYSKYYWHDWPVAFENESDAALSALTPQVIRGVNQSVIRDYLNLTIAPELARAKSDVTIDSTDDGSIVFDGFALNGQHLNVPSAIQLIKQTLDRGETVARLPLVLEPATVTVLDPALIEKGIVDLLSTGETDFSGSPHNRRHNIEVGLHSFTGQLIPPLSKVALFRCWAPLMPAPVICPSWSLKAIKPFRNTGADFARFPARFIAVCFFAGLPIDERRNHSYSVSYYDPQGLDATIYPGSVDLKFTNDTDHHILIQTITIGDKAYANVYGTKVHREVDLVGPYYYSYRSAPPARVEYSTELPPGKKEVLGAAHVGFKASWYRRIDYADRPDVVEHIYSDYQARPSYTVIGVSPEESVVNL